ncbi:MAG: CBS domain-containing protein [Anaerolineae bacterium]
MVARSVGNPALVPVTGELTRAQELVYELQIGQVMTRNVAWVTPEQDMREIEEILRSRGIGGVPVLEAGHLVGIVSVSDLIRSLRAGVLDAKARELMTTDVLTVREDESVIEAVKAFAQRPVSRLVVVDDKGQVVGIVTGGDITRGLLRVMDLGYRQSEISHYRASHIFQDIVSDDTSLRLRYHVKPHEFAHAGEAASKLKRALQRLGWRPEFVRRVAVATYEGEMNLVIHSDHGGEIVAEVRPDQVRITVVDDGPGIEDIEAARQPGFSTAPDWIRELGFGAGIGLSNIEHCADEFTIESTPGMGTKLNIAVRLAEE